MKIDGKEVKSIKLDGKEVQSIKLDGKTFSFAPTDNSDITFSLLGFTEPHGMAQSKIYVAFDKPLVVDYTISLTGDDMWNAEDQDGNPINIDEGTAKKGDRQCIVTTLMDIPSTVKKLTLKLTHIDNKPPFKNKSASTTNILPR